QVARVQPMKLAAMEGIYNGSVGQDIVGFGILNPDSDERFEGSPMLFSIDIPKGLSWLIYGDGDHFVAGINDLIDGRSITARGDTVYSLSYSDKMVIGAQAREALRQYAAAREAGDSAAMEFAASQVKENFQYFGYAYLPSPRAAVPPVGMTFYAFHIMVFAGGFLMLFLLVMAAASRLRPEWLKKPWLCWLGIASVAIVWICSQSGWVLAEVGRQPWVIQDLMPTTAAISGIPTSSVKLTFWIFAALFTGLLIAEMSIMLRYISSASKKDIETSNN
ncbi:MAG: cytochrome ubiquinol oxidase subunit I, partial [Muribaculaceae bacterium]|nr:cytochrome ubiquinol oxidase subunit I [Muribaculaceae bacterium]